LLDVFPAAFMGRMSVIPYIPLDNESLKTIVGLHLERIAKRLGEQYTLGFHYSGDVVDFIIAQAPVAETGVRTLIRYIEKNIMPLLGGFILRHNDDLTDKNLELTLNDKKRFAVALI